MLVSVERRNPRLIIHGIIFEVFQRICGRDTSTSQIDRLTDRRTNCCSNTALCVVSRGKMSYAAVTI